MGQSPSVSVTEQSPWDHEREQSPWVHEIEQRPWVLNMEQSPWVPNIEQSPSVHEMEQSHWVPEIEQSLWVPDMEQSPWVPDMEQSPWVHEMEQSACISEMQQSPWVPEMEQNHWTFESNDVPCGPIDDPCRPIDDPCEPIHVPCGPIDVPCGPIHVHCGLIDDPCKPIHVPCRPIDIPCGVRGPPSRLYHEDGHFKVPHRLRQVNQAAYEPELISIGPCHRNKQHLRDMEEIKWRFFLQKDQKIRNRCFEAMRMMEEQARNWYETSVVCKISSRAFMDMMVVDGCFIIELLCKETQDQIAPMRWRQIALFCDLLLLENQLPFFVLVELYGLITQTDGTDFAPKAFDKLIQVLPVLWIGTKNPSTIITFTKKIDHLLGLVYNSCFPSPQGIDCNKEKMAVRERQSIRCAIKLEEYGIEFTKVDKNQECNEMSLFDVNFTDGKMKIPTFVIDNNTERFFHNLIAYELFVEGPTYVIDYVTLMDNLVNTANDVQLLRSCGVIQNKLGDDEAVVQMLNKLLDNVTLSGDTSFYEGIFADVNQHCSRPYYILMAIFNHEIISRNPWKTIGYVTGVLTGVVTIIQFILSFFTQNNTCCIMD